MYLEAISLNMNWLKDAAGAPVKVTNSDDLTLAASYDSIEALKAACAPSGAKAEYIPFHETGDDVPIRFNAWGLVDGSATQTGLEDVYLVVPGDGGAGVGGVMLVKIGENLTWTATATAASTKVGSDGTSKHCTLVWGDTGNYAAFSGGKEIGEGTDFYTIPDIGAARGVLRVYRKGTGTNVRGLGQKWR